MASCTFGSAYFLVNNNETKSGVSKLIFDIVNVRRVLPSSSLLLTLISSLTVNNSLTIAKWFFYKAITIGVVFQAFSGLGSAPYFKSI